MISVVYTLVMCSGKVNKYILSAATREDVFFPNLAQTLTCNILHIKNMQDNYNWQKEKILFMITMFKAFTIELTWTYTY